MEENKTEVKETQKKTGVPFKYKRAGKALRGFLCILAGLAILIPSMLIINFIDFYGTDRVFSGHDKYYNTSEYVSHLISTFDSIYYAVTDGSYRVDNDHDFNVINVSEKKLYTFDYSKFRDEDILSVDEDSYEESVDGYYDEDGVWPEEETENFEVTGPEWGTLLSAYGGIVEDAKIPKLSDTAKMYKYLKANSDKETYIHFDDESFKEMFVNGGFKNEGHRFSDDFSENSYFLFDLNKSEVKDLVKSAGKKGFSLDDVRFAVYDEDANLYYSTGDDFFAPTDSYTYHVGEVLFSLDSPELVENEEVGEGFDEVEESDNEEEFSPDSVSTIMFALLSCCNYSEYDIVNSACDRMASVNHAEKLLEEYKDSAIKFALVSDGKVIEKSNDIDEKDIPECITSKDFSYKLTKNGFTVINEIKGVDNKASVTDYGKSDTLADNISIDYPGNTFLVIGFDEDAPIANEYLLESRDTYESFVNNRLWIFTFLILGIISWIALVISLISTTGRKEPRNKNAEGKDTREVVLTFYDKLPTELYIVLSFAIAIAMMVVIKIVCVPILDSASTFAEGVEVRRTVAGLPFINGGVQTVMAGISIAAVMAGFTAMIFGLSFVRRIKARDLWKNSLLHRIVNSLKGEKFDENIENAKGVKKLLFKIKNAYNKIPGLVKIVTGIMIYILLNVVFMFEYGMYMPGEAFLIMMLLQILAVISVIRFLYRLEKIRDGIGYLTKGDLDYKIELPGRGHSLYEMTDQVNHIGDGLKTAVDKSLKDERMKTELITNVSHDLKTPLTSIINYIDLLKKENIEGENAKHYLEVLDVKSQRLKQLTEDLVEAAKVNSGNVELERISLNFTELLKQAAGEFGDKFKERNLELVMSYPEEAAIINVDGRRTYRIIENIFQNTYKYALEGTRVYGDLTVENGRATFVLKNISSAPLNITADELMERFTRGDSARSSEGSGLGLSIARDLTVLQDGTFDIELDGDLFKVIVMFLTVENN